MAGDVEEAAVGEERSFEGQVVLITGAGRGQGRSHALAFAERGASVLALDVCAPVHPIATSMASRRDLDETVAGVEALGARCVALVADVRDASALRAVIADGVAILGRLDHVVANAGVCAVGDAATFDPAVASAIIDVNLTGVWHTASAAIPHLRASGGGSICLVSSTAGLVGLPFFGPYAAAKHGVVGIAKTLALELGADRIRVNSIHPAGVDTAMTRGLGSLGSLLDGAPVHRPRFDNVLPTPLVSAREVSEAVLFLASAQGRHVTGLAMTIDAGASL